MYLKNGKEIYECEQFPGYYIEADTGNFCDENGNLIGGNLDNGDKPGSHVMMLDVPDIVYTSKTGKLYYPAPNKTATIPMDLDKAHNKGMKPSPAYNKFVEKIYKKALAANNKKKKR